jgi:hypothetical protein
VEVQQGDGRALGKLLKIVENDKKHYLVGRYDQYSFLWEEWKRRGELSLRKARLHGGARCPEASH